MKKAVAFLLAFLIFVTPMTTFVKADVVIGDNDDIIVNENATILGRKLAMLESLSDLALSGVTEFTISNTEDVDSYLDSLWSEINDAIDYLDSGDWVEDIPSNIASKYYTNLVKYRDIVNNRGEFLGFDLQNPATSLLKTYFANDTYGRKYTSTNLYGTLDTLRALSTLNHNSQDAQPSPDFSFISNINKLYVSGGDLISFTGNYVYGGYNTPLTLLKPWDSVTLTCGQFTTNRNHLPDCTAGAELFAVSPICTVTVSTVNNGVDVVYSSSGSDYMFMDINTPNYRSNIWGIDTSTNTCYLNLGYGNNPNTPKYIQNHFDGMSQCMNYLYDHYCNINLYVDGVPWALVNNVSNTPNLDIDGFIKLFGNDQPQQYQLQPNTQIDYDQLYQVIYNAIRDNLPISQGDINYYDSHDTIYSPTIINNYGEEEGDESNLIDTILDYAVIPKFDTAIAQPMRQALTNGVVIMQDSITNVIPNEILLILGACFFLLLFAVVINRMIK